MINKIFEYKIINIERDKNYLEDKFNKLGAQGWELVNIIDNKAYFKKVFDYTKIKLWNV